MMPKKRALEVPKSSTENREANENDEPTDTHSGKEIIRVQRFTLLMWFVMLGENTGLYIGIKEINIYLSFYFQWWLPHQKPARILLLLKLDGWTAILQHHHYLLV